ncbi:MAG: ABC transporter substrate-binding protein [Puniceicoccaceae bacterium]|nr:MAG: ABC transporter substrate-binding protein [Puniceicoccaceae bacterium]
MPSAGSSSLTCSPIRSSPSAETLSAASNTFPPPARSRSVRSCTRKRPASPRNRSIPPPPPAKSPRAKSRPGPPDVPFRIPARIRLTLLTTLAGAALAACAPHAGTPPDAIVVAQVAEPRSLDPHVATATNDFRILAHVYEGLVRFQPGTLEPAPGLAASWSVSADGRRYTFLLREDVRFHDGTPFDAEAVRFNFERMLDPEHPFAGTGPFPLAFFFSAIESIETPDDHTVIFELDRPYAPFLSNLAYPTGFLVSPAAVRGHGRNYGRHPAGTGPYRFTEWARQRWVKLEHFDDYWGEPARMPRLVFRPLPDENARLTELLAGGVDLVVEAPADIIGHFRNQPDFVVAESVGPHLWFLILNTREPPFDDLRMRRAVNYAIDKDAIVEDLLQRTASVAHGVIPRAFDWAIDPELNPYPFDPDKARELIAEAGHAGATIRLLATESGSAMLEPLPMAEAIQADLARVGLTVRIEVFEWNTFLARVNAGLEGQGHMAQMAWMTNDPDTLPSLALASTALPEDGGFNSGYYQNPELDRLLEDARRSTDPTERGRIYHRIDRLVHEEAPFLFLASWRQNAIHHRGLRDFALEPSFLLNLSRVDKQP